MGNIPSITERNYGRKPGKSPPATPTKGVPYVKNLDAKQLSKLYPFLEKQAARLGKRVDALNSKAGAWEEEYNSITDGNGSKAVLSNDPANGGLNRYRNIVAYDKTRVVVEKSAFNNNNEYLNASWIPGYKQKKGYIASQGPIPESMPSFWHMVWREGCKVIVMVTNEIEGNKLKCHRYWPSREDPEVTYGAVKVTMQNETVTSTFIHRVFLLECEGGSDTIDHYQYTVWPDHGVPNTTGEILSFRKVIRKKHPHASAPMLVHCSAGVGRTGTFIVIDTIMNRAERLETDLDIRNLVKHIRCSRNYLVQTLIQYQFCFRAILEAVDKALVKTVRAVGSKKDEIGGLQFDLGELEGDIGNALDSYAGDGLQDELLAIGGRVSSGVKVDVRWSAFDAARDKASASNVPPSVRRKSLEAAENQWHLRGNVPVGADAQGYASRSVTTLGQRVEALAISAGPDAWRKRYAEVAAAWVAEVYDVTASLNPLESRMMSLAGQKENWKLRGKNYRDQIEATTKDIIQMLEDRLKSLSHTMQTSEDRWRNKGDGFRTPAVREANEHTAEFGGSFSDRLNNLVTWVDPAAIKSRGTADGREVENPAKIEKARKAALKAEQDERTAKMNAQEQERIAAEKKARAGREAEAARLAERPTQPQQVSPNKNVGAVQKMKDLSPVKGKDAVHPMIAQNKAMMGGQSGKRGRRQSKE